MTARPLIESLLNNMHRTLHIRLLSTVPPVNVNKKLQYKLLVVGGGAGGCSVANVFAAKLGHDKVAVIEPAEKHYYQPMWTLVGGGMKHLDQSARSMGDVLPKDTWIKDAVRTFEPARNRIVTAQGKEIEYEYMVVAIGIQLRFDLIAGLPAAFDTPGVCSNYHKDYVLKTMQAMRDFRDGNAIFTFPNTPIKCAGAPQKIMYIAQEYFRKTPLKVMEKTNIIYNTSLPVIFGVKKYAAALRQICEKRNITVNYRHNLVKVIPEKKQAVFDILDEQGKPKDQTTFKYEMLHVGAPCSAPEVLRKHPDLTDANGFLSVNKETMQHTKYSNIFGIGDCTNVPTAKTAAAVAGELGVVRKNLDALMKNKPLTAKYDGYTSCPLVTGYSKCILAEFDYNVEPLETLPFNQARESRLAFFMKRDLIPRLYFDYMLKGKWEGPRTVRKLLHLGMSK